MPLLIKFVIEKAPKNPEYAFPFAKATIEMIKMLCKMIKIGESGWVCEDLSIIILLSNLILTGEPEDHLKILYLTFFLNNDGIYEFFGKCLRLFAKLWIEMKAQHLDFDRVKHHIYDSFNLFNYLNFDID